MGDIILCVLAGILVVLFIVVMSCAMYDPRVDRRCNLTDCRACPFPCDRHNKEDS